jgi:hypothetical protein
MSRPALTAVIAAGVGLVAALVTFAISSQFSDEYEATATLALANSVGPEEINSLRTEAVDMYPAQERTVLAASLGANSTSVVVVPDESRVLVKAIAPTPAKAAEAATAIADEMDRRELAEVMRGLENERAAFQAERDRLAEERAVQQGAIDIAILAEAGAVVVLETTPDADRAAPEAIFREKQAVVFEATRQRDEIADQESEAWSSELDAGLRVELADSGLFVVDAPLPTDRVAPRPFRDAVAIGAALAFGSFLLLSLKRTKASPES